MRRIVQALLAFLLFPFLGISQNTTSSLGGIVKTNTGDVLVGATITATHEPTGTVYKVQARTGGRFDISNMNPGGPYKIEAAFTGFATEKKTDIYLSLGEKFIADFVLGEKATELTGVTVSTTRKSTDVSSKGGTETVIDAQKIQNLPSVGRNLQDYLRFTPQAKFAGSNGNVAGVSIAGQNNRYNSLFVDGAVNNDVFGLSATGTNGGQAGVGPISMDAIDQFQVVVSPYDVSLGNFTGGGISATTKRGTNTYKGSIYYYYQNQDLAGKTPTGDKAAATKFADFTAKNYGFTVGGAIIKNKLFFFFNGDLVRNERPQPFNIANYTGNSSKADIDGLGNYLRTKYGYEPGGYLDNPEKNSADRIAARIDWNINPSNSFSLSYRYAKAERYNAATSSSTSINFYNNGEYFPSTTNSVSAELKTALKRGMSNRLLLTYTGVVDDRNPTGQAFPRVRIFDGAGSMYFGSEEFSTFNYLKQNNIALMDYFKINKGKHSITIGTDNELSQSTNTFIRQAFGSYQYANLNAFLNNLAPTRYDRSFSKLDNKDEKTTDAAARFNTLRLGLFVSDEVRVNDNLTLTMGVRADYTKFLTTPKGDSYFGDSAAPVISQFYDLQGAATGVVASPKVAISPRIGFIYKIPEESVTIRGGVGLFTGRVPLVWPGGVYNNNGISIGSVSLTTAAQLAGVTFRPDPYNQYSASDFGINTSYAKGQLDLIAKNFKMNKMLRTSLAIDKKFDAGWRASVEGIFTKNINEIYYQNVNLVAPSKTTGIDVRNYYTPTAGQLDFRPQQAGVQNPYASNIFLLSNNKNNKGFAYNATISIGKSAKSFDFNASYTYGSSYVVNEGTSSQNNSQWRYMETVNGRNFVGRSRSDFDMGHRIYAYVSKKFNYAKHFATTISLVYNGQSGNPYSYVYSGSIVRDYSTSESNDLIYVPTTGDLAGMTFNPVTVGSGATAVTYTGQQQKDMLNDFIGNDKYLRNRRGEYAERNGARLPFTHIVDLKIQQDFNIKIAGQRYQFQLVYDVFNFTNMLNRKWGRQYFLSNDNYALITFAGSPTAPAYQFRPITANDGKPYTVSTSSAPSFAARWMSQIGIRFNFN